MATTNPFRLLKGDNEDPTQLAARAPQTNAAVNPFEAGELVLVFLFVSMFLLVGKLSVF